MNIIELAKAEGLHIYPKHVTAFERFAAEVIKAHTEELIEGVGEPAAYRYHSVSPFKDKEGMHKVSDKWSLIDKPNQRDAHSAMCGMEAEPLFTASQVAGAVAKHDASFNAAMGTLQNKVESLEAEITGWKADQKENMQIQVDQHQRIATLESTLRVALEALEEATTYTSSPSWSPSMTEDCNKAIKQIKGVLHADR